MGEQPGRSVDANRFALNSFYCLGTCDSGAWSHVSKLKSLKWLMFGFYLLALCVFLLVCTRQSLSWYEHVWPHVASTVYQNLKGFFGSSPVRLG